MRFPLTIWNAPDWLSAATCFNKLLNVTGEKVPFQPVFAAVALIMGSKQATAKRGRLAVM